ncbi:hypothetical protein ISN45_At02g042080 [Arabidopsis thaliana x Arabidopsis arenosa]|uniref:Uncharacterized protein n=2 Tax=Arabidopsis TaxID=3701 RepID=A0A8T2GAY0_ARASU|nr:hypothetical protein ISN45_At02g042080 [Arabidopsis thaliana x Arabidopsis arenosa]KAG7644544.1 hypothetical protein ISN44_As02g042200 [Arabidopsis suecica]
MWRNGKQRMLIGQIRNLITGCKTEVPSLEYTRPHHSQQQRSTAIHL